MQDDCSFKKKRAREAGKALDTSPSLHKSTGLMQRRGSLACKVGGSYTGVRVGIRGQQKSAKISSRK